MNRTEPIGTLQQKGFELLLQGMPCHDGNIAIEKRD